MKKNKINIILIEPSEIMRRGLSAILNDAEQFFVMNTFSDLIKFQEQNTSKSVADIVIINPIFVSYTKRNVIKNLFPNSRLVALLYNYIDRETLAQFDDSIEVYDKPAKIIHRLEQSLINDQSGRWASDSGDLSDREKEILVAVAKGMLNKEIADFYNISIHTVMAHRKNISRKTGIKSVSGFVVYALLNSFVEEYEIQ